MSATVTVLDTAEAMRWFAALPRDQQVRSLAPDFALADTQRAPGLACLHVGYAEGDRRWLHTFHRRTIAGGPAAGALSAYGYGGPLCTSEDPAFVQRAWSAWQAWAAADGIVAELCRFHPEAPHHAFFLGEVQENRDTVTVDLALDEVASQYNTLARRKLRKAEGVPARWSTEPADWRRFGAFYREAMAAMGAQARYHFADAYFEAMAALPGIALCICGEGDAWLSAGMYLFPPAAGGVVEYHLGASSGEGHARGTAYLLQHAAALEGRRRGHARLYLGGGTTPAPDNPLLFYKRCFSRRLLRYRIGLAVHAPDAFEAAARAQGYDRRAALPDLLFA